MHPQVKSNIKKIARNKKNFTKFFLNHKDKYLTNIPRSPPFIFSGGGAYEQKGETRPTGTRSPHRVWQVPTFLGLDEMHLPNLLG